MRRVIGIHERLPILETIPLSIQHLTAMFGATILVPILLGVNPAIALLMNGIGTIIYTLVTKGGIPAYLGSSFAFIAPVTLIIQQHGGFAHAQAGFIFFGLFFIIVSLIIRYTGIKWINIVMPAPVMGAVVAVIGLELAPVAAQQAGLAPGMQTKIGDIVVSNSTVLTVSLITLAVGVFGSLLFRGFFKVIPILISVIVGYLLSMAMGIVDYSVIEKAKWFALPDFSAPVFDWNGIFIIAPACIVVLAEHIGHLIVTGNITETDLVKDPGLHRSLLGDGISNVISGFTGSPPNTTYGENIGVMALTRVYSVWVIRGAAIIAILLSCIGKFAAVIQTIPMPVMGGVTMLLYGIIAAAGIRMLVEQKVDFSKNYNMVLAAVVFTIGVSGASITFGSVQLKGMAFAAVTGVVLSIIFYILSKLGILNEDINEVKKEGAGH